MTYENLSWLLRTKMKLVLFFKIFKFYNKKLFKTLIYEIYFSIKYFKTGNYFRFQNIPGRTNTLPCSYYFIHKISQFVNKNEIKSTLDLGSGFGRITNFLDNTTKSKVSGYEIDKEVCDIAIKNKNKNVIIENKNVLKVNYENLEIECFIIVDLFDNEKDLENLVKKINSDTANHSKKNYFITINVAEEKMHIFKSYKLLKCTSAGKLKSIKFFSN